LKPYLEESTGLTAAVIKPEQARKKKHGLELEVQQM